MDAEPLQPVQRVVGPLDDRIVVDQRRCPADADSIRCLRIGRSVNEAMIKQYNNISITLGVPGLLAQAIGGIVVVDRPEYEAPGIALSLVGSGLLVAGLAWYAMAKGRHPAWCLVVLLVWLLGLAVLLLLGPVVYLLLVPILTLLGYGVLGFLKDYSSELYSAPHVAPPPAPNPPAVARPMDPSATFPSPAPGHDFNAYGVCVKCGCGRSAARRPCTPSS